MNKFEAIFPESVQRYFKKLFEPLELPPLLRNLSQKIGRGTSSHLAQLSSEARAVKKTITDLFLQSYSQDNTDLPNRRFFKTAVEYELARIKNGESSGGAIVLMDVDNLHNINRTFGFAVGDKVLLKAGSTLQESAHNCDPDKNDIACHLGGDEFAVLITDTHSAKTQRILDEIKSSFHGVSCRLKDGKTLPIRLTIVAEKMQAGETYRNFMHRADRALIEAKSIRSDMQPRTP